MSVTQEKLEGELLIKRIPKNLCWGTPTEFVRTLQALFGVTLNVTKNLDFVVVGHTVPKPEDKFRLWVRLSRSGIFQGFFMFQAGSWQRVFNKRFDEVTWLHGDSREIPEGFELITTTTAQIDSDVRDHIVGQYLIDQVATTATNTVYKYFAVRYIGAT